MAEFQEGKHGFFRDFIDEDGIDVFFDCLSSLRLAEGDLLFGKGDRADGIYFVVSGRLAVQKETGFGERRQVVALLEAEAPVGEGGLLGDYMHSTSVTAVEDTDLLFFSLQSFSRLCEDNPKLGLAVYRWVLRRVSIRLSLNTERLAHIL